MPEAWIEASMSSPDSGSMAKVIGTRIAIAITGPRPGMTPIHRPKKVPATMTSRCFAAITVVKPSQRLSSIS